MSRWSKGASESIKEIRTDPSLRPLPQKLLRGKVRDDNIVVKLFVIPNRREGSVFYVTKVNSH